MTREPVMCERCDRMVDGLAEQDSWLLCKDCRNRPMIRKGDTVKIRPEWQDVGDTNVRFVALEDENGGRVRIEAKLGLTFNPNSVVTVDMLEVLQ